MCDAWLTFDILFCTASILNLCAIALDRYWATHFPCVLRDKTLSKNSKCQRKPSVNLIQFNVWSAALEWGSYPQLSFQNNIKSVHTVKIQLTRWVSQNVVLQNIDMQASRSAKDICQFHFRSMTVFCLRALLMTPDMATKSFLIYLLCVC